MKTLDIITTGAGHFKPGLKGKIVAGGERDVFPGESVGRLTIPEFTVEIINDNGRSICRREFCQYGRDFIFA